MVHKEKGNFQPIPDHEGPEVEYRYGSTLSLTLVIDRDGWSKPRTGRFTPQKDSVPIVQEAGWTPGAVWTGEENLAPNGIRSQDRPARSESLYQLPVTWRNLDFSFSFLEGVR